MKKGERIAGTAARTRGADPAPAGGAPRGRRSAGALGADLARAHERYHRHAGRFLRGGFAPDRRAGLLGSGARSLRQSHADDRLSHRRAEVLRAVAEGRASVGVLPVPEEGDARRLVAAAGLRRIRRRRASSRDCLSPAAATRARTARRLAIGRGDPEVTGSDRSLLRASETSAEMSRGRPAHGARDRRGFEATCIASVERRPGATRRSRRASTARSSPSDPRLGAALAPIGRGGALGSRSRRAMPRPLTTQELAGRRTGVGDETELGR